MIQQSALPKITAKEKSPISHNAFNPVCFEHPSFVGNAITVDYGFTFSLLKLAEYAESHNVKIWVTSSLRHLKNDIKGAIVPPAKNSCHHVGHAIDMNIQFNGTLYNSKKLKRDNLINLPQPVRSFIDSVRQDDTLRWGGDFKRQDPVHIDDNVFHKQKDVYFSKLGSRMDRASV